MRRKTLLTALATAVIALAMFTGGANASQEKVTLCHASGLAGTTHYVTLTVGYPAAFGPAGHFSENGTPNAGHEQDYLGPCLTSSPTPEPTPTTTPTSTPSPEPSAEPTPTPTPTATSSDNPSSTPDLTPTPTSSPTTTPDASTPAPSTGPVGSPSLTMPPTDTASTGTVRPSAIGFVLVFLGSLVTAVAYGLYAIKRGNYE